MGGMHGWRALVSKNRFSYHSTSENVTTFLDAVFLYTFKMENPLQKVACTIVHPSVPNKPLQGMAPPLHCPPTESEDTIDDVNIVNNNPPSKIRPVAMLARWAGVPPGRIFEGGFERK